MFALWCFKYVSYHPTKNKNGALLDESEFKFSSFKSWYVHFIVTSFNLNVCVSCYIDMKTVHKMCSWFCLKLFFFFKSCSISPKKSTPPQRPSRKDKEGRNRPSIIDLPLPPTLLGGDSSPPQLPVRQPPLLPQTALKKRPKSAFTFILTHLKFSFY